MLSSGHKTHGYARYSPLLYFPLFVLPDGPLQSTLEPRSSRSLMPTTATLSSPIPSTTSSSPSTRSSLEVPRQEASPFRSVVFVLAFLRQIMCTLCLYSDTFASANFVLSSCCIRALVAPWLVLNS